MCEKVVTYSRKDIPGPKVVPVAVKIVVMKAIKEQR
jgi:hypothetical protein